MRDAVKQALRPTAGDDQIVPELGLQALERSVVASSESILNPDLRGRDYLVKDCGRGPVSAERLRPNAFVVFARIGFQPRSNGCPRGHRRHATGIR